MLEPLFSADEAALARAVERRRRELGTIRACARIALAHLSLAVRDDARVAT